MALLLAEMLRRFSVSTPRRGDDDFDDFDDNDTFSDSSEKKGLSSMVRKKSSEEEDRILKLKRAEEARVEKERQENFQRKSDSIQKRLQEIEEVTKSDDLQGELKRMITLVANRKEQARKEREERERHHAHEEFMHQYHAVMSKAKALNDVDMVLFDELYHIKYPKATIIKSQLPTLVRTLKDLRIQYRNCRLALQICNLQSGRAFIEGELADSNDLLNLITQDLNHSFVKAQASGRKNINLVLQPKFAYLRAYIESQESAHEIQETSRYIYVLLKELASESPRYRAFLRKIKRPFLLGQALHQYRQITRTAEFYRPLGHTQVHTLASNLSRIGWKTFGIQRTPETLKWSYQRVIATILATWYLPRWSSRHPRDPELDITWRYIDVLHPFDVARACDTNILNLTGNIGHMLATNDSPSPIIAKARADHAKILNNWHKVFQLAAGSLESEISSLRYITWARLTTESKIHALGGVPDTVSRGLFCSRNPLSQDLRKFFEYTHAFSSSTDSSSLYAQELNARRLGLLAADDTPPTRVRLSDYLRREILGSRRLSKITAPTDRRRNRSSRLASSAVKTSKIQKTTRMSGTSKKPPTLEPPPSSDSPESGTNDSEKTAIGSEKRAIGSEKRAIDSEKRAIDSEKTAIGSEKRAIGKYSTSSRNTPGWPLEEKLKSPVNGADEEIYPTIDEEVLVASELKPRSSQSPTPPLTNSAQFWSHKNHQGQNGKGITVHYCRTLESAERVAKLFSESRVIGFDLEWKAHALATAGIKSNLSLLQIADQDRIALFHIALFQSRNHNEITPPSLRKILESADTVKVGVNIKADCTRVRRHLGIEVQGQLELSHLYKLVKYSQSNPKLVNRRVVNLSQQVEEILGLPLYKENDVRCSDWSRPLAYTQVQYAASDPFACLCLYHALELKRKALHPIPPSPAYAELNLPILVSSDGETKVKRLGH
ncbi:uncharacterized protein TRUGW13939_09620 [Talaromyces rugulosus]|uniref:3'-5' exonuclease domain-containing protein n=1 Tax=Talaromyces rugulosus TaxID=121627 RepID=A0A7H8R7U2_TALRU|nr:uncharacterized protein TRUGW13939_09620 [Talaromyces rugulosus]QKX62459.1 hypothetical protein TRUGW13939_09620 [Talaromyces rugulosus]